jgi:hypothetical protein
VLKFNLLDGSNEFPFSASLFANPPFRSYFFLCLTVWLVVALSILGFVLAAYWPRLPAISVYWLSLVGVCMITIWVLALRCYRRIHDVLQGDASSLVRDDSPVGVAASSAAGMIFWGLFFGYFMTAGVLMQLAGVLSRH